MAGAGIVPMAGHAFLRIRASLFLACGLAACSPEAVEPEWLVGRWAVDEQPCEEAWLIFDDEGGWTGQGAKGRWRVEGHRLTLALTHERGLPWDSGWEPVEQPLCHTESVRRRSPDELVTWWEDGSRHRLRRCTPATALPQYACFDCEGGTPFEWGGWFSGGASASRVCGG